MPQKISRAYDKRKDQMKNGAAVMNDRYNKRQYMTGMGAFFLSGICAISAGVIVSILRDLYQFNYSFSGTLISVMSVGNMAALLLSGLLPKRIGERATTLLLCCGYFLGYLLMVFTGNPAVLIAAFLAAGIAKGCTANKCTILVGNNAPDRSKALSLMNAWFALGALLCPFMIAFLQKKEDHLAMAGVSAAGLILWLLFLSARIPRQFGTAEKGSREADNSFLKNPVFWMLASLMFFQNAAEYVVNGWIVTYYKGEGILSGTTAAYTVTVQWALALIARLLMAFGPGIRKPYKALSAMGVGLTAMYLLLLRMETSIPALIALGLFSFSIAGVYPLATACIGEMTSSASVGVLLSVGGLGGIIFPWLVGFVADNSGLRTGMAVNLIPCVGIIILPFLISRKKEKMKLQKERKR